jgi:O-antigen/teichoic acid export membrane protein
MSEATGGTERLARSATWKVLGQATRVASVVLVIVAARVLGPADFGKFTFAYALATLLGIVLDFGMAPVLTRAVARDPSAIAARWGAATTLKLGLLGVTGPIYLAVPLLTDRPWDTTVAVWVLGFTLTTHSFIENAVSVFTAVHRLEQEFQARLVEKILLISVGLAALGLGLGLTGLVMAFALAAVVSFVFATRRIHRRLAPLDRWWRPAEAWQLGRDLAPVAQAQFLSVATSRLAPIALALLVGDLAAGHFGAAFRVYDVAWVVVISLEAAVYPELARTAAGSARFVALSRQALDALLLVALPIALGLGVGSAWLTSLVYGQGYGPAAPVLAVLGTSVGCAMLAHFLGAVLLAIDRPRRLRAIAALAGVTGLIAVPALVTFAGTLGGALAVLVVDGVTLAASVAAVFGVVGWPFGRGAAKGLLAAVAGGIVAGLLPPGAGRLGGALLTYGAALAVLRPVPGAMCVRLLRGALGRRGPTSPAGIG